MTNCERPLCERFWPDVGEARADVIQAEIDRHQASNSEHVVINHPNQGEELHGVRLLTIDGSQFLLGRIYTLPKAIDRAIEIRDEMRVIEQTN